MYVVFVCLSISFTSPPGGNHVCGLPPAPGGDLIYSEPGNIPKNDYCNIRIRYLRLGRLSLKPIGNRKPDFYQRAYKPYIKSI